MPNSDSLKVAVLWHMHQPDYREPQSNRMALPWVRLHALKDYLDMPLLASEQENIRVTFNLVPSLLDQIQLYIDGGTDRHFELSRLNPQELSDDLKHELLNGFFLGHPATMIDPYPRFRELHRKYKASIDSAAQVASLFSTQEFRDIQVWSNLVWIDPTFREEPTVSELFSVKRHFTEEQKHRLLDWQLELMKRIVPCYKNLQDEGKIEVSFTPYYHPILPLLCDTESALETLPELKLPKTRFQHPEDARTQINMAIEKYRELFGHDMAGMWPSEGSISEETLNLMNQSGLTWAASDEEVLYQSLKKSGETPSISTAHRVYKYGDQLRLMFRDHHLSDRIGFVYSNWDAERAVSDFLEQLLQLRSRYVKQLQEVVVPVVLDGENAWEYFVGDGLEFLRLFYSRIEEEPRIKMITFRDAARSLPNQRLKSVRAGSWINHNFRIWIGHSEDNASWELLSKTRDQLVDFQKTHSGFSPDRLKKAWSQIYRAEGSDWNWWYGDEHKGPDNASFDRIYRGHLIAIYQLLDLEIPVELLKPILDVHEAEAALVPDGFIAPVVDGRLTQYYEWSGSGYYDCSSGGGSMHQVDRAIQSIHYGYDRQRVYFRIDLEDVKKLSGSKNSSLVLTLYSPDRRDLSIPISRPAGSFPLEDLGVYAIDELCEVEISREKLWTGGFGEISFTVSLRQNGNEVESWPDNGPISLLVPEPGREVFWPI